MKNCNLLYFDSFGNDNLGYLTALESNKNVTFDIKRIYYTYSVPKSAKRGMHAHKKLNQILICINGELTIKCFDGENEVLYTLDNPNKGLFIGSMIWHELIEYRENTILIVLASDYYNENDYIRDYNEFILLYKKEKSRSDSLYGKLGDNKYEIS